MGRMWRTIEEGVVTLRARLVVMNGMSNSSLYECKVGDVDVFDMPKIVATPLDNWEQTVEREKQNHFITLL